MFRNYLLTARRNLTRQLSTSLINLFGLAIGIAAFLLVFLYIRFELSFDDFYEGGEQIYRITSYSGLGDKSWGTSVAGYPMDEMNASFPDVEAAIGLEPCGSRSVGAGDMKVNDVHMACTTSEFFDVFSVPIQPGASRPVLERPNTVVISESLARRIGPQRGVVGGLIPIRLFDEEMDFEITGIYRDFPSNSTLDFDALLSRVSLEATPLCTTCGQQMWTRLEANADTALVADLVLNHIRNVDGRDYVLDVALEPLSEVHFSPYSTSRGSDMRYVFILSTIGIAILLIACANYMNLATARASKRVREIGVRKVMGAGRGQLMRQFLIETLLVTLIALPVGLVIMALTIPVFNDLAQTSVHMAQVLKPDFLLGVTGVLVVIGLLAGSYPALYLSRFRPISAVSGRLGSVRGATAFRRSLVVFQFAYTIILISGTILIRTQLHHVQTMDMGFDKENVVLVDIRDQEVAQDAETLRAEIERLASVESASAGYSAPGVRYYGGRQLVYRLNGSDDANGPSVTFHAPSADSHFLKTMGLDLIDGRNIRDELVPGEPPEAVVNEETMRVMDWESIADAQASAMNYFRVVGVVKDFNFAPAREPIEPLAITQNQWGQWGTIVVRYEGADTRAVLDDLEGVWQSTGSDQPFTYSFLTEEIAQNYISEQRSARVFTIFAVIAIAIGCLGLFALAAYTAERRRKEIGIRKVMGAGFGQIVGLLSREFAILVAVSFVLAVPLIWIGANRWLENFVYRVDVGLWLFASAGATALVVALVATVFQSGRAALANPADTLRYE